MADLIDRDAIFPLMESKMDMQELYLPVHFMDFVINEIPAVNQWIPCRERMPEPLRDVIVCTVIKTVTVAWINGNEWYFADTGNGHIEQWSFDDVTHWMPLPEPPESEVQNDEQRG